nr:ankyrin repeat-containing domain, PGG domain protein [Tanacetum cinerariifolium]
MSVASTSNSFIPEIEEESPNSLIPEVQVEFPYPSHNFATNIVTVKLSDKPKYNVWNTQMQCLLSSHDMLGFIDGQFPKAKYGDMKAWYKSDSLVKGWIIGSLSEEIAINVVNRLTREHGNSDFTAKDVWDELQCSYSPSVPKQA